MNLCPQTDCTASSHDTASAWRRGCRSEAARRALLRAAKQRRHGLYQPRLVDDVSVGRKLQALAVIGWHIDALAAELGITRWGVNKLRTRTRHNVDNIKKVAELYDRLSMTPGGDDYTARISRARRWPGPLCWDDIDDPSEKPKFGEDELGQYRRKQAKQVATRGAA